MKIAFDHQAFTSQNYGGISRYYTALVYELLQREQDVKVFSGFHRNNYVSKLPNGVAKGKRINKYPRKWGRFFHILNHTISNVRMTAWQPDIIHETYYSKTPTLKSNAVRVTSAYDMIHELFCDQFSPRDKTTQFKKSTFKRVDHIICISQSTKRDLMKFFDVDEKKITVVHLGVDLTAFQKTPRVLPGFEKPFILFVGSRGGYKNFSGLLKAFASSKRLMTEFDIVSFGSDDFNAMERESIKQLGFKADQVRQICGGDDILASLYNQAVAFVYPSVYEGFGLPPLEAMSAGCPVISSNTSSMPEVVRNSGVYFDPSNIEAMKCSIENVVFSDSLQKDLISLGYKNINDFSWQKCADETLYIYRKLTGKS